LNKTKFKGSEENTVFYEYLKTVSPLQAKLEQLNKKYIADSCNKGNNKEIGQCKVYYDSIIAVDKKLNDLKDQYIAKNPTYISAKMLKMTVDVNVPMMDTIKQEDKRQLARFNYYKAHYFDNIDLGEDGMVRTPILEGKINYYFDNLVAGGNCDSAKKEADRVIAMAKGKEMYRYLVTNITTKYEKTKIMCMDCMTLHMFDKYYVRDSARVDWISKETRVKLQQEVWKLEHNQCGSKVYPLEMADTTGKLWNIYKVDAEYTIMYFWSATCGHCKKTTPKLKEMYDRLKDQYDVEVYSVHIDKKTKEFDAYVKEHKFTWILTYDK
jgi:thiol-disulfide isomerase/thioredoxin